MPSDVDPVERLQRTGCHQLPKLPGMMPTKFFLKSRDMKGRFVVGQMKPLIAQ